MADKPKVLIVGSGGREDALGDLFARSGAEVLGNPGNAGTPRYGRNVEGDSVAIAKAEGCALVVVGPEGPLAEGLGDRLKAARIKALAPTAAAARIESSKRFGKEIAFEAGIPVACSPDGIDKFPYYVKCDGLVGGKGSFLVRSKDELAAARAFAARHGGDEPIYERALSGTEFSSFVLVERGSCLVLGHALDFKRLTADPDGPMTGGMGSIAPHPSIPENVLNEIALNWADATRRILQEHEIIYEGILYLGGIRTADGFFLLEYNCRWGDPEAQAILPGFRLADPVDPATWSRPEFREPLIAISIVTEGYPFEKRPILISEKDLRELSARVPVYYGDSRKMSNGICFSGGRILTLVISKHDFESAAFCHKWIGNCGSLLLRGDILDGYI